MGSVIVMAFKIHACSYFGNHPELEDWSSGDWAELSKGWTLFKFGTTTERYECRKNNYKCTKCGKFTTKYQYRKLLTDRNK